MKAHIIRNPVYQELEAVEWVRNNVIFACPYDGPAHREQDFRRDISTFFWHIVHCTIYNSKFRKNRLPSISFPYLLGREKLPMVFGANNDYGAKSAKAKKTDENFCRAFEWLKENVFDISGWKYGAAGSQCRAFRIKRQVFKSLYPYHPRSGDDILRRVRYCSPVYTVKTPIGRTISEIIGTRGVDLLRRPIHDFSALDRNTDRAATKTYKEVLSRQEPITLTLIPIAHELSVLSKFYSDKGRTKYRLIFSNLMNILSGDFKCHDVDDMKISYHPRYVVSPVGGRLYEKGGGFQNMPRIIKQRSHISGYNHDMQSSQLNILKMELTRNKIECASILNMESVSDFGVPFGLSKDDTKVCFYATVFSLGRALYSRSCWHSEPLKLIAKAKRKKCIRRAAKVLGKKRKDVSMIKPVVTLARKLMVRETLSVCDQWNEENLDLAVALDSLCNIYVSKARKSQENSVITNAAGVRYSWPTDKLDYEIRKKIMSHMITGIETKLLFDMILSNDVKVYSFEHDGALLSRAKVVSPDIKFVRKPFDENSVQLFKTVNT